MDSIESELLAKLVNVFGFNFKKNYPDLTKPEFLDVYKLLLRCYDDSWILNVNQADQKSFKQIQGYLKISELGHLIGRVTKFDELVDPKRNARLLGGLISKLESRHPGAKLQGVIRKIKLAKPNKTQTSKRVQRQDSSSSSAGEEEQRKEFQADESVVPAKGKEIPRTPPVGGKTDLKSEEFIKPALVTSPRTRALNAAANKKNFQPILPTKEIPRTPLKGSQRQELEDISVFGRNPNLTVDFSASRLSSSNTSTPIEERSSSKPFNTADATFVVPSKDSESSPTEELASPPLPENKAIRRGTFVLTHPTSKQHTDKKMSQEEEVVNTNSEADEHQADAEASPKVLEPKKKGGKQQKKNAKSAPEPEKLAEDTDAKPEISDGVPAAPKGRKGRGKREAAQALAEEAPAEESQETAPAETEMKGNKKRGKKGKPEPQPEQKAEDEPAAPEAPAPETSPCEAPVPTEDPTPEEPTPEAPAPGIKGKRGRGKAVAKAVAKQSAPESEKAIEEAKPDKESMATEEPKPIEEQKPAEEENVVEEEKLVEVKAPAKAAPAKKGRGRKGKQQDAEPKDQEETKESEEKPVESAREPSPVPQPKTKGRGKQTKEPTAENAEVTPAESSMEPPQVPEIKKGRGKMVKQAVVDTAADESIEANESAATEVSDVKTDSKAKKGRGKKTLEEAPVEKSETVTEKKVTTPEVKQPAKGGRKAAMKPETEPTRKSARNKPEAAKSYDESSMEATSSSEPEPPKKGRGKKGKAVPIAEEKSEKIEEPKSPLRAVNGADEVASPPKRKSQDDESSAAADDAPPEKKKRGRAMKKETVQPAQAENQPPVEEAPKKGAKKAATSRKKPADAEEDEADETASPSKPKKAAKSPQVVSEVSDPSPAAPAKGRRLKMVQGNIAASAVDEPADQEKVAPPAKRGRARKAK